jgi:Putative addiction module component
MGITLDKMTVPEKLQLMEALWADLSRHEEDVELPAWHGQVLRETEQRVADGKEIAVDWETAKRELRERFP